LGTLVPKEVLTKGIRGNVGYWHKADMSVVLLNVRFRGQSGQHLLILSLSAFDP